MLFSSINTWIFLGVRRRAIHGGRCQQEWTGCRENINAILHHRLRRGEAKGTVLGWGRHTRLVTGLDRSNTVKWVPSENTRDRESHIFFLSRLLRRACLLSRGTNEYRCVVMKAARRVLRAHVTALPTKPSPHAWPEAVTLTMNHDACFGINAREGVR